MLLLVSEIYIPQLARWQGNANNQGLIYYRTRLLIVEAIKPAAQLPCHLCQRTNSGTYNSGYSGSGVTI